MRKRRICPLLDKDASPTRLDGQLSKDDKLNTLSGDGVMPDLRFAELLLQRGVTLLQEENRQQDRPDMKENSGDGETVPPVDLLARRLALAATVEAPLVSISEDGEQPEVFARGRQLIVAEPPERALTLAGLMQPERAVMFEFDGTGPLTGNRVVAAVLRPEGRHDLVESWIAIGRLREGTAQMTVAPAVLRFDAAALAATLSMIAAAGRPSSNAANAALGHASRIIPMAELTGTAEPPASLPVSVIDLYWQAIALAVSRGSQQAGTHTLH